MSFFCLSTLRAESKTFGASETATMSSPSLDTWRWNSLFPSEKPEGGEADKDEMEE